MAMYGIFTGGITLMLVAFFVYIGGSAELEAVSSRAVLRSVRANCALIVDNARVGGEVAVALSAQRKAA